MSELILPHKMKYWQENSDTACLKFYGVISYWYQGAEDFTNTLQEIEGKYKNLKIRLHCYGGEVLEGTVIYNAIAKSSLNIEWIIEGVASSMGAIIPLAKGTIKMCNNAFVMFHAPTGYTQGNAQDHFSTGKLLKNMQSNFAKAYAKKTGKTEKDALDLMDGTDHWFNSDECASMKIVDQVIDAADTNATALGKPDPGTEVEKIFNRYTAFASTPPEKPTKNLNSDMDKATIISKFNLTSVTAESSDTAVLDALSASFKAKDQELEKLKNDNEAAATAQATSLITAKETALKLTFTEDQKKGFLAVAKNAGIATLQAVLDAMKPAPVLASMVSEKGKPKEDAQDDRKDWTLAMWQEKDPDGLQKLPESKQSELYTKQYGKEPTKVQ